MLRNSLASLSFLTLALAACTEGDPEPQRHFPADASIQALIQSRVDEERAVGIVVGVMEADGSTRVFAAGTPGPDAQALGERSVFEIGSITKVFTGILLADMTAKGEVALEDPVARYLPNDEVTMPTRGGREITFLDLATHRSALPRLPENFSPADDANPYADYTVGQMYEFLSNHELRRDIGAEAEYSNLGTGLLGHALARASGKSYGELVRERILEPLGMTSTAIELSDDMRRRLAKGHGRDGSVVSNWDVATLEGAGALRSNMTDMLKFIAANTGPAESPLEQAMRASHEVRNSLSGNMDIGLSWLITPAGDRTIVWHNGGTGGYRSFSGFDPDKGVAAIVLTNSNRSADDIGMHLINANVPLREPPPERTEIELSTDILGTYVGEYRLASGLVLTITVKNGGIWSQATGQSDFQIYPESETEFFYKVVDAQITFEKDDSGNVTGLVLHQGGADMPAPKQ